MCFVKFIHCLKGHSFLSLTFSGDTGGLDEGSEGAVISAAFTHMRTVSAFSIQHQVAEGYAAAVVRVSADREGRAWYFGAALGFSNSTRFLIFALLFW